MLEETLVLVSPSLRWEAEYQAMIREFLANGEGHFNNFPLALSDFATFITELEDEAAGRNLPAAISPQQTYWTAKNGRTLVGEIRLRPTIPPPFELQNGHIGYNIRPLERRKGYGTRQLTLGLEKARAFGLERVMLLVEEGNQGSERIIAVQGGWIEGQEFDEAGSSNYWWIDLHPEP